MACRYMLVQNWLLLTNQEFEQNMRVMTLFSFFVFFFFWPRQVKIIKSLNVTRTPASSAQKPDLSGELIRWQLRWVVHLVLSWGNTHAGHNEQSWTGYLNVISTSWDTSNLALCNNNVREEPWTWSVLSKERQSAGLLYISRAKKKRKKENDWVKTKDFLTAKKVIENTKRKYSSCTSFMKVWTWIIESTKVTNVDHHFPGRGQCTCMSVALYLALLLWQEQAHWQSIVKCIIMNLL